MKYISLICVLIFLGCQKSGGPPAQGGGPQAPPPPEVQTLTTEIHEVPVSSELPGRVRSFSIAEIRPQVSGIVLERLFVEGSFVKKGQQLYQIDPSRYRASYDIARARLKSAKASLGSTSALRKRYASLIRQNAISKQELDDVNANYDKALAEVSLAKAEVRNAKIDLEYTKVYSPISGFVGKSSVTKGALVNANQEFPLAVVRQLDPVYVDLSQPSAEALELKQKLGKYILEKNKSIEISLRLAQGGEIYPLKGKLEAKEMAVNEQSATIELRAVFPNPNLVLLPGMFVRAYVDELGVNKAPLVPQKALMRDKAGEAFVYVVREDNSLERRRVVTGPMYKQSWVIESGLDGGERIALDNLMKVGPEMTVNPVPSEETDTLLMGE